MTNNRRGVVAAFDVLCKPLGHLIVYKYVFCNAAVAAPSTFISLRKKVPTPRP